MYIQTEKYRSPKHKAHISGVFGINYFGLDFTEYNRLLEKA
jgi:hypothetical protein